MTMKTLHFSKLPIEIWLIIFRYLDQKSKKSATLTSKRWFKCIRQDTVLSGCLALKNPSPKNIKSMLANWPALKYLHLYLGRYLFRFWLQKRSKKVRPTLESLKMSTNY